MDTHSHTQGARQCLLVCTHAANPPTHTVVGGREQWKTLLLIHSTYEIRWHQGNMNKIRKLMHDKGRDKY